MNEKFISLCQKIKTCLNLENYWLDRPDVVQKPFRIDLEKLILNSSRILIINPTFFELVMCLIYSNSKITIQGEYKNEILNFLLQYYERIDKEKKGIYDICIICPDNQNGLEQYRLQNINFFDSYDFVRENGYIIAMKLELWNLRQLWYLHVKDRLINDVVLSQQIGQLYGIGQKIRKENKVEFVSKHWPKIAVCSIAYGEEYRQAVRYGQETVRKYCEKHGYDFRDDLDIIDSSRSPQWYKIRLLQKCVKQYEYVLWIDADAFIMNPEIKVEELVQKYMVNKDMVVAVNDFSAMSELNTGVILIKGSKWSEEFLARVYDPKYKDSKYWDQTAFTMCYNEDYQGAKERIKVLEYRDKHFFHAHTDDLCTGDFILHLLYCNCTEMLERMMDTYCPIRMKNEDEERYKSRINFLGSVKSGKFICTDLEVGSSQ